MSARPRVWVTRARPGADRTAERLRALDLEPVVQPLLAVQPLSPALPDLDRFAALVFTSLNGVAAYADLTPRRDAPVFAVGDATAQAARDIGFTEARSAAGDLDDLVRLLVEAAPSPLLAIAAETPAGDLTRSLREAEGRQSIEILTAYRTVPTAAAAPAAIDAVLIHSPRAAQELADHVGTAADAVITCISPAAAAPLQALGRLCAVSPQPNEAALLATLQAALGKRDPRV
jgi:uroporphyrinogen-III synthase